MVTSTETVPFWRMLEKSLFHSLQEDLDSSLNPKSGLSRHSNHKSLEVQIIFLISNVSIEKIKVMLVNDFAVEVKLCLVFPSGSWYLGNSKFCYKFCFISLFRAIVLRKWSLDFFNQRPTQKFFAFGEGVVQKVTYIGIRLKTLIVRKTKMCYRGWITSVLDINTLWYRRLHFSRKNLNQRTYAWRRLVREIIPFGTYSNNWKVPKCKKVPLNMSYQYNEGQLFESQNFWFLQRETQAEDF